MSNQIDIIRNPEVYSGNGVDRNLRSPFEISTNKFCEGQRNSVTDIYQTYSPYSSDSINLSDMVNIDGVLCQTDPIQESSSIYKNSEDIVGNRYLLFKDQTNGETITQKKNRLGVLRIINNKGVSYQGMFGNFNIPVGEMVKDVQVYFNKVVIITDNKIWFGNVNTLQFFSINYNTHVQTTYHNNNVYILHDLLVGDFDITIFDGDDIKTITNTSLTDIISSSDMKIRKNHIEVIYTDSVAGNNLVFSEYDILTKQWSGFNLITFPYEIIGVINNDNKWLIYYETTTYPNNVGGVCIDFKIPTTQTQNNVVDDSKSALQFTFNNGSITQS